MCAMNMNKSKSIMKTKFLIGLLVIIVFISGCAEEREAIPEEVSEEELPSAIVEETADWKVYRNEKYGFEVKYPPHYSPKETLEDKSIVSFGILKPSPVTGKPMHSPYLVIWALNNPKNYTLEKFYNFYSLRENNELMEEEVGKQVYPYYKESDSIEPIEINGISAVEFWVGDHWRMTISIPYKDKIFEIHGTKEEEIFNQTLSTFRFLELPKEEMPAVEEKPTEEAPSAEEAIQRETTQLTTINFLTYENPAYGIRIKYPQDWKRREAPDMAGFVSPEKDASLIVNIFDISTHPMTPEEYKQHLVNQCKMQDCNIIDSGDTTLANNLAYKVVYTIEGPANMMVIFMIKDNKLYSLTYTAGSNEYSKYLDIINEMVDSFEII